MLKYPFIKTNGKPLEEMTADQWQACFSAIKSHTKQIRHRTMTSYSDINAFYGNLYNSHIIDDAMFERYSQFVNDILKSIRAGREDYCFYVYQIADLLQFEHDRLIAEWIPRWCCFKVSLDDM